MPPSSAERTRAADETPIDGVREQLIKSRQRVKEHGEVFTPSRMVNQMLDLVQIDLETGPHFVDSTFLEPSAGDGNFLIAILARKLLAIEERCNRDSWGVESLFAVASIYGIELLDDNVLAAKSGLLGKFVAFHESRGVRCNRRTNLWKAAKHIIDANILQGDTLTGLDSLGGEIEFSWWNRVPGIPGFVKREPFTFVSLREASVDAFDFAVYETFKQCRIDQVHKETSTDA